MSTSLEADAAVNRTYVYGIAAVVAISGYAETFIVPAAVGPYEIRPPRNTSQALATLKAFVRS